MRTVFLAALALIGLTIASTPTFAQSQPLIPERRVILLPDADMPGNDISSIFDTTFDACQRACLADADCQALTYNQGSRACFPKSQTSAVQPFEGALSGQVISTDPAALANARTRANVVADWLKSGDLQAAYRQAQSLAARFGPASYEMGTVPDNVSTAAMSVIMTDYVGDWWSLAEQALNAENMASDAASMAINAYLRSDNDEAAGRSLALLARAWQAQGRGRDSLNALRLADRLSASSEIAAALAEAEAQFGFRVTDTNVMADGLTPRVCFDFTAELEPELDYSPYIRLPDPGIAVDADGAQLCLDGVRHGQELKVTLRAGLPAADGARLDRDVPLTTYIRDRTPAVRFPGRAYVLPASGDQGLEMVTTNLDEVQLRLMQVSDRNLVQAIRQDMFARPLDRWSADALNRELAEEVWSGHATVAGDPSANLNRDLTTRLAIPAEAGPLAPGIYVLQASIDGMDAGETGIAAQWFVISDIGISTLWGSDGLTVVARALSDAGAVTGAEVTLISRANAVLARAETDGEGVVRFDAGLTLGAGDAAPAMVMVAEVQGDGAERAAQDVGFLSLTGPEFDLSDRGVEGQPSAPPIDVFLATDRGAYRAGETIHATILARDDSVAAINDLPLTAIVLRPDGVEAARLQPTSTGAGGYVLDVPIADTAPRGTWRLDIMADPKAPALASTRLLVEDFLPERIDFTTSLPEGPLSSRQSVDVTLDARWLFGVPAAELPVEGILRLTPAETLPGFDGVHFGRHDAESRADVETLPMGETDADGRYVTTIDLPDGAGAKVREAKLIFSIREGAGRPVERDVTRLVMPDVPVLGIRPLFDGGTVAEGTEAGFEVIAVAPDLTPTDMSVEWALSRIDTDYQWYAVDGRWNWEAIVRRRPIAQGTAQTGEPLSLPVDWGQYELRVTGSGGSSAPASMVFDAGWGASAEGGTETPDQLTVTLDQPNYRSGDTARIRVDAEAPGEAIVSVLTNRVVAMQIVELDRGKNALTMPVTDEWGAGAYVTVSALHGLDTLDEAAVGRTPVRALGLSYAPVDPGARALPVAIDVPASSRPRGTLPVTLTLTGHAEGETAYATVAVVDQGILNLTDFETPDPSEHYFGQRRLGVALRDLYGRLILSTGAADGALREGGDANAGLSRKAPPPTEQLMSWFSGPVTISNGTARLDVPVPDFNGEVRIMAVAWTDEAIGEAEAVAQLRYPIVMTVTAPAFMAPGDMAQISLDLTHVTGPTGEATVTVETPTQALLNADTSALTPVTLSENGRAFLSLPLVAGTSEGDAALRLVVTTPGGEQLTKDISVTIMAGGPEIMRQSRQTLAPGEAAMLDPGLTEGLRDIRAMLTAGPFAALDIAGALGRLARYPYGCTEQVASVALPLIHLPELAALTGRHAASPDREVTDAIETVLTRQSANGGFGLWGPESGDLWLTAYITDFLSQARQAGYDVPDLPFQRAISYLQNGANSAVDPVYADADENAALAYASYVLAHERAARIGDLRYYADAATKGFKRPLAAAQIGAALAAYGDQPRADRMFDRAARLLEAEGAPISESQVWRGDYGSTLRDRAGVLALAVESGSNAVDLARLTRDLATQIAGRSARGWGLSTQESLWVVLAGHALAGADPELDVNGRAMDGAVIPYLPQPQGTKVRNTGDDPLDVTVTVFGQPTGEVEAGGRGYAISRDYFDLDGAPLDPSTVAQGTRMVALLTVTPFADGADDGGGRLMVNDPLPAGFEIDNPHLLESADAGHAEWLTDLAYADHAEFLADRFSAAIDWRGDGPFRLAYMLRAVTPGAFTHPAASVEDMYRPEYRAWTDSGRVMVTP